MYTPPRQQRAQVTEQRFLRAFDELLLEKSFSNTTIQDIAAQAGLDKGAFLKRFGSKKRALLLMFEAYCTEVYATLADLKAELPSYPTALDFCLALSTRYEALLRQNFSSNRAMNEIYLEELQVDPLTKGIFMAGVDLLENAQAQFADALKGSRAGALAAAQLVLTINYNFALKAMPALPADDTQRQALIAHWMVEALQI